MEDFTDILACWELQGVRPREDLRPAGSPERMLRRTVFESPDGAALVLEEIAPRDLERKVRIARTLATLAAQGLTRIVPYLPPRRGAVDGSAVCEVRNRFWQLRPYVRGQPLPRPGFGADAWRGQALAEFQVALRAVTPALETRVPQPAAFSWVQYVRTIGGWLDQRQPGLGRRLAAATRAVAERLEPVYAALPTAFVHGDFHPLNVIWQERDAVAVIDWEFCGRRVEAHDAALLLGCVGFDEPDHLVGALAQAFLVRTGTAGLYSGESREHLVDLVIAIRFGWMREWVFRKAGSAIQLELDYLALLLRHRDTLTRTWSAWLAGEP